MTTRPSSSDVYDAAALWLAREDAGSMTPADAAELREWFDADKRHLGAYMRLRAASRRLDRLAALKSDRPHQPAAAPPRRWWATRVSRRTAAGIAATLLVTAGTGLWVSAQPRSYQTGLGEMRRVTLRDGSVVELNTDTAVKIAYSAHGRDIWLRRGEGNFVVAKDPLRPFVVHVGEATFTAVGTAFSIRADAAGPVTLTVSEGVVSLKPATPEKPRFVAALQQAAIAVDTAQPSVASVSFTEVNRRLAWTEGRIALAGETLGEAAAEFNRYNDRKLIVAPEVAQARVGGLFRTSEVDAFARSVQTSLGFSIHADANGDIRVDAADGQAENYSAPG